MKQLKITDAITPRNDTLNRYMTDITHAGDLLTPDQEAELARKAQSGDKQARSRLITSNTRFVISVAKKYRHCGVPMEDLISAGNEGLIKAVDRFDQSRGFKFISYGVWWIRQPIYQYIHEHARIIKIPANIEAGKIKARAYADKHFVRSGEHLDVSEVASELGLRGSKYMNDGFGWSNSLSDQVSDHEGLTFEEVIADDSLKIQEELVDKSVRIAAYIRSALGNRNAEIILMTFGIGYASPLSRSEISERMDLCPERIRQLVEKSIQKLRRMANIKLLLEV